MTEQNNQLAEIDQDQAQDIATTTPPANAAAQMIAVIADAAQNPNVDVNKMSALLDMQERIMDRQAREAFVAAKAAMSSELPNISKNRRGHNNTRYATWDKIHRIIKPILARHGFDLGFNVGHDGNMTTVEAVLSHVQGHVETSGAMKLPNDQSGHKNSVQAVGSTVSYGKRYTTLALLNISTDDDTDGETAPAIPKLTDHQTNLIAEAKSVATGGLEAYHDWFKGLTRTDRLFLASRQEHEDCKKEAGKVAG